MSAAAKLKQSKTVRWKEPMVDDKQMDVENGAPTAALPKQKEIKRKGSRSEVKNAKKQKKQ